MCMYVCYSNNKYEYLIIIHIHVISNNTAYHVYLDHILIYHTQYINYTYHILALVVQQYTISNSTLYKPRSLPLPPPPRRRAGHTSKNAPQQTPMSHVCNCNQ